MHILYTSSPPLQSLFPLHRPAADQARPPQRDSTVKILGDSPRPSQGITAPNPADRAGGATGRATVTQGTPGASYPIPRSDRAAVTLSEPPGRTAAGRGMLGYG